MSVDDRLREAFATLDPAWEARRGGALAEVTRRHRRGVTARRAGAVGTVAATGVVLALALGTGGDRDGRLGPAELPSSPQTSAPSVNAEPEALGGRWHTGSLTAAQVREWLDTAGYGTYADDVLGALPAAPFRLVWILDGGLSTLMVVSTAETATLDVETVTVVGDEVRMTARFASATSVHRWRLVDGELQLSLVSTTEGPTDGVPGEAWQRLLYNIASFAR